MIDLTMLIVSAHDGYPRWLDAGADFIEVDVRRSRAGVIVLAHDDLLEGVAYPAFDEMLDRAAGRVGLQLDLKEEGYEVEVVAAALRRFAAREVVVTTGVDASLRRVKARFPEVRTGLTRRHVEATSHDFIALDRHGASPEALDFCARHGIAVWVWTVDDGSTIRRLLADRRISGLITNRPDVALRLRSARS
jgi:glycerophosphoryl diester phosphodiesterase